MKRLSVSFLLLLHMNYFMFLPQTEDKDVYDIAGRQIDDINSVVEYINVALGLDKTADDEDDDKGNSFTVARACDFFCQQITIILCRTFFDDSHRNSFVEYKALIPNSVSFEIISPPPEA